MKPLILQLVVLCSQAWEDGELAFLDSYVHLVLPSDAQVIGIDFTGRMELGRWVGLAPEQVWSDGLTSNQSSGFQDVFKLLKNMTSQVWDFVDSGPGSFRTKVVNSFLTVEAPARVSEFVVCVTGRECGIDTHPESFEQWSVTSQLALPEWPWEKILSKSVPRSFFGPAVSGSRNRGVGGAGIWAVYFKPIYLTAVGEISQGFFGSQSTPYAFRARFPLVLAAELAGVVNKVNLCGINLASNMSIPEKKMAAIKEMYCSHFYPPQ